MPRGNEEEFFREKITELDDILPPDVSWSKARGWNQLQAKLPAKRRPKLIWYQAAAVTIFLVSTLLFLKLLPENPVTITRRNLITKNTPKPAAATIPDNLPPVTIADSELDAASPNLTANRKLLTIPKSKRSRVNQKKLIVLIKKSNESPENSKNNIARAATGPLEKPAELLPTAALSEQKQIKIMVVLGGKSRDAAVASSRETNNKANRRKNKRLKLWLDLPGELPAEDSSLAATANPFPHRSALRAEINL